MHPPRKAAPSELAPATARDFLANERTFLAYGRTALAFLGFGFVIARFSIFSREFGANLGTVQHTGVSITLGIVMVAIGVIVGAYGSKRYIDTDAALRCGESVALSPRAALLISGMIAVFGAVIAIALYRLR